MFQASFFSTALKTLISVSTVILLGLIFAYHALEVQVCTWYISRGIISEYLNKIEEAPNAESFKFKQNTRSYLFQLFRRYISCYPLARCHSPIFDKVELEKIERWTASFRFLNLCIVCWKMHYYCIYCIYCIYYYYTYIYIYICVCILSL